MDKDILEKINFENNFLKQVFGNIGIDYNSKRIDKYAKKLENSLFEYLMSFKPNPFIIPKQEVEKSLKELIHKITCTYFGLINQKINGLKNGASPLEMFNTPNVLSFFNLYFFDFDEYMFQMSFGNFNWIHYQELILNYKTASEEGIWNFNDIYYKALITSSINNIKRKSGELFISKKTAPIDSQNYFLTLPSEHMDYINIFKDMLNLIKVDIMMFCNNNLTSNLVNFSETIFKDNFEKKKQELDQYYDNTMKNIEEEINKKFVELQDEYKLMADELNNLDSLKNKLSLNKEVINNQNETIKKLMKENNKLKEKYNNLASKIETNEEFPEKEEISKEIDTNLNYVFLASEDITFKDSILNAFPNSKIISNNRINLNPNNIDYVIVLTNHIGHAEYYGVKEQCKNKDIPFLHSPYDNIDMIKELIYENINVKD